MVTARMAEAETLLSQHVADPGASWSVGEMGVLAEFHHAGASSIDDGARCVRTAGGALRLSPVEEVRILAYETPSANPRLWNHGIAFCLPRGLATMGQRTCITELGPDRDAILESAREELLFDLGMGLRTADFCIRTTDLALIDTLRSAVGRSWFAAGEINRAIVKASPARVVLSRLARVEVSNPIPPADGVSPVGPHTHVLPDLIRHHRVHDASIPVPAGSLPCLTLYPAHPARDAEGRERPFDLAVHASYQRLLERYGDAEYVAAKQSAQVDHQAGCRSAHLGRLIAARQRALLA